MNRPMGLCLNWKVLAGLAAVGVGIWTVAPNLVGAALPLLLLAACPLSMLFMMRGMGGGQCAAQPNAAPTSEPAIAGMPREEQIAVLKAQLAGVEARQRALAEEVARLEAPPALPARDDVAPASSVDERAASRA